MLTDAHCHPCDLSQVFPEAEKVRKKILSPCGEQGVIAASSACGAQEFAYNEVLSRNADDAGEAALLQCFAVHPQLPAVYIKNNKSFNNADLNASMEFLRKAAKENKIAAVGEFGFDLYNDSFRETEKMQDNIFEAHLETALDYDLPVILHVRRAMHKIFVFTKELSKCKAVVFHSWPGTPEEALSLLRRGVNAYFSFGNIIMLNHKQAKKSCALLPAERLLTETDAPFQPQRGKKYSSWKDLPLILETAANLRSEAGNSITVNEFEKRIESNFKNIFC